MYSLRRSLSYQTIHPHRALQSTVAHKGWVIAPGEIGKRRTDGAFRNDGINRRRRLGTRGALGAPEALLLVFAWSARLRPLFPSSGASQAAQMIRTSCHRRESSQSLVSKRESFNRRSRVLLIWHLPVTGADIRVSDQLRAHSTKLLIAFSLTNNQAGHRDSVSTIQPSTAKTPIRPLADDAFQSHA
jgi:hypothetical protein